MEIKKNPKIRFPEFTEDWEQRKLGDIVGSVFGGGTPKTSVDEYWDGDIPWIQSSNVQENEMFDFDIPKRITQLGLDKSAAKLVPEKSIAVVTHVGVGKLVFVPFAYTTSQDFTSLAELKTDPKFTCYSLYKRLQDDLHIVQGSAIKGITKDDLLTKEIMVPEKDEQIKIGEYFRNLDNLITLHRRKCDSLKELKKGLLQKMFPKNGAKVPEIRFPGFTEDWEQRKFGDVGTVSMCKRIFKDETTPEGDIPFFKIGTFGSEPDAYISRELFEEYKSKFSYPEDGAILLSASGTIGRIVEYNGEEAYFQDSNIVWLSHDNSVTNKFLKVVYPTVKWDGIEGSTIQRLYNDNFLKTKFMMPSIPEQEKLAEFFEELDNLITLHQRKYGEIKVYKKSLLQKMFL
ncbi:restriction endonuclease subunit S [Pseudobutyrivibrio sp. LB2011]|uniref:restriction endonuclease subunit S n=1 Tax=Pseudobutyrivibrio sp. LB2011 TaxID=1408312 RepID=UPI0005D14EDA|nr:restriction endonuclease subunit S [Pseudobutyrivibrio sp. LB2011]